jgi:GTP-binding protein
MTIKSAKFDKSFVSVHTMDDTLMPEFAFIGRSNVGKSSLINMLVNQKSLAKTSSKPGKTRIINRFLVDENWYLVDLPGYGFAKVSKKNRALFDEMITEYLVQRQMMATAFILIDIRLEPQKIDLEFIEWCGVNGIPFQIILTKADKVSATRAQVNTETFKAAMYKQGWETLPSFFVTSANKQQGKEELISFIDGLRKGA